MSKEAVLKKSSKCDKTCFWTLLPPANSAKSPNHQNYPSNLNKHHLNCTAEHDHRKRSGHTHEQGSQVQTLPNGSDCFLPRATSTSNPQLEPELFLLPAIVFPTTLISIVSTHLATIRPSKATSYTPVITKPAISDDINQQSKHYASNPITSSGR